MVGEAPEAEKAEADRTKETRKAESFWRRLRRQRRHSPPPKS